MRVIYRPIFLARGYSKCFIYYLLQYETSLLLKIIIRVYGHLVVLEGNKDDEEFENIIYFSENCNTTVYEVEAIIDIFVMFYQQISCKHIYDCRSRTNL